MIGRMTAAQRDRFYGRAARMTSYLSVETSDGVYLVRAQDQNVGRSLFVKQGRGEMRTVKRAVSLVKEAFGEDAVGGRQLLDVGANIGTSTISALRDQGFGSAICFEPEPRNVLTLRLNLLLNGLEDRVQVLPVAVSNASGTAQLMVDPEAGGENWIATDSQRMALETGAAAPMTVPTVSLDQLVEDGTIDPTGVGLLWMDAQAHEGHILEGAGRLVELGVPIALEWDPIALEKLGNRGGVETAVAEHYTHFIDLRPSVDPDRASFQLRSAKELKDFGDGSEGPGGRAFTDLVVMRLKPAVAKRMKDARKPAARPPTEVAAASESEAGAPEDHPPTPEDHPPTPEDHPPTPEDRPQTAEDREVFFRAAAAHTTIVSAPAPHGRFLVQTRDVTVGLSLFANANRSEMGTLKRAVEVLTEVGLSDRIEGRVFVDVGANIGTTCITALHAHGFSSAVACEPAPDNYRMLELNSILNGIDDRLVVLPIAVSDTNAEVALNLHHTNSGGHQIRARASSRRAAGNGKSLRVEAMTLNHLLDRGILDAEAVGMVWLDVQGAEGRVVQGASALTRLGVPFVLEFHPLMLERGGRRKSLERIISTRYTHFVDLRRRSSEQALEETSKIGEYSERLRAAKSYSDILIMRLEREPAAAGKPN
jgi:FkbM family methyltransferase